MAPTVHSLHIMGCGEMEVSPSFELQQLHIDAIFKFENLYKSKVYQWNQRKLKYNIKLFGIPSYYFRYHFKSLKNKLSGSFSLMMLFTQKEYSVPPHKTPPHS